MQQGRLPSRFLLPVVLPAALCDGAVTALALPTAGEAQRGQGNQAYSDTHRSPCFTDQSIDYEQAWCVTCRPLTAFMLSAGCCLLT